jgi:hypothetical protein
VTNDQSPSKDLLHKHGGVVRRADAMHEAWRAGTSTSLLSGSAQSPTPVRTTQHRKLQDAGISSVVR